MASFSGSAIVKDDKLYLLYTGHVDDEEKARRETQCLAGVKQMALPLKSCLLIQVIHTQHIGDRRYYQIFVI